MCDFTDGLTTFALACGEQHCVGAHGYFCEAEQQVRQAQCMMLRPTPDAAPQPAPKYQGRVDVEIRPAYNQGGRWYFEVSGGFVTDDDCERTKVAGCAVTVCAYPLSRSTFAAPGKMSVGPTLVGGNYSWTPGAAWLDFSSDTNDWAAGELVHVAWTGDRVPSGNVSVASPRTAEFSAYALETQRQARTSDRALQWPAIASSIVVRLTQKRDARERVVECAFPANSTGGAIPQAALAMLPAWSNNFDFIEEIFGVDTRETRAGELLVTLRVLRGVNREQFVRFR